MVFRADEGHEAIMRQAFTDLAAAGYELPVAVDPDWLILGNVQTDIPTISLDRRVSWRVIVQAVWRGTTCIAAEHPAHAMRCRGQSVSDAYAQMIQLIRQRFEAGVDPSRTWEERARQFGSALHTIQDSYCTAHAQRIQNAEPTSPLIDMFTYPSKQHPFTTSRDGVWEGSRFKPEAAAAILTTVQALKKFFVPQTVEYLDEFAHDYLSFRPEIKGLL